MHFTRYIFGLLFILISNNLAAQSYNLSELIKINKLNLDDFDTYVTKKGYTFYQNNTSSLANETSYFFKVNGVKTYYISKYQYKDNKRELVSFQTPKNTHYLNIKLELKQLGFKFVETRNFNESTFFVYEKGGIELSLISTTQQGQFGGPKQTVYEISVKTFRE
jgi:hypothetical protein